MKCLVAVAFLLLYGCSSPPPPAPAPKAAVPKVFDESRYLPKTHLLSSEVVEKELLGKPFMPGGTLAHYKQGARQYEMFVVRTSSAPAAALLLLDWKKALASPKLIAHFGGYCGEDGARTVFVFAKGEWFTGVVGLPEKEADLEARTLAAGLP